MKNAIYERIGETAVAKNGQLMTITGGTTSKDLEITFEDGTVVCHKEYSKFKKGQIGNPNCKIIQKSNISQYIGQVCTALNGQRMTIIGGKNASDLTIQFEDGTIVEHKEHGAFKKGQIKNPSIVDYRIADSQRHIGETSVSTAGQSMTLIGWTTCNDISIQFEDGTVVTGKRYSQFIRGNIENPKYTYRDRDRANRASGLIGQSVMTRYGMKATVLSYVDRTNVEVEFEDGCRTVTSSNSFKKGYIKHPKISEGSVRFKNKSEREGKQYSCIYGGVYVIDKYDGTEDVTVRFDYGYTCKVKWRDACKGVVNHPLASGRFKRTYENMILKHVYSDTSHNYFECTCLKCRLEAILSDAEILEHRC